MIILCVFCFVLFQRSSIYARREKTLVQKIFCLIFSKLYFLAFLFFDYYFFNLLKDLFFENRNDLRFFGGKKPSPSTSNKPHLLTKLPKAVQRSCHWTGSTIKIKEWAKKLAASFPRTSLRRKRKRRERKKKMDIYIWNFTSTFRILKMANKKIPFLLIIPWIYCDIFRQTSPSFLWKRRRKKGEETFCNSFLSFFYIYNLWLYILLYIYFYIEFYKSCFLFTYLYFF